MRRYSNRTVPVHPLPADVDEPVHNDITLIAEIADELLCGNLVLIRWRPYPIATPRDILFCTKPTALNFVQVPWRALFVSVLGVGSWGFGKEAITSHYVADKLRLPPGPTTIALAELIAGIIEAMGADRPEVQA